MWKSKQETASLVVENAQGTVVKTAFAYKVYANNKSVDTYNKISFFHRFLHLMLLK